MSNEIQQIIVYRNHVEAPVGERDAYEAWKLSMKPYGFDGFDAYQAGAAYQRAQQPQNAGRICMGCVEQASRIRELEHKMDYYTTPQPSAGVVMPERKQLPDLMLAEFHESRGWNACLDEFARLNGKEVV